MCTVLPVLGKMENGRILLLLFLMRMFNTSHAGVCFNCVLILKDRAHKTNNKRCELSVVGILI